MTTLARLLHLDDGEFPALRAQIEAQPMPRVGVPATTRRPLRIDEQARSIAALAEMRRSEPSPAELMRHALDMALAPLSALLDMPSTDPCYRHRVFLVVDSANEKLAQLHASTTAELNATWWSVAGPMNNAAAKLAELAPFAAKAGA